MYGKKVVFPAPFLIAAAVLTVAGGLVSAINSASPFDRGSWFVAYLVLVGGVAQAALAYGRMALGTSPLSGPESLRLLVLWNFGSLAVPLGVLADIGLVIGLGSIALLAGLWLFAHGIRLDGSPNATGAPDRRARRSPRGPAVGYLALVAMLAVSVAIGCLLADAPLLG